MAEMTEEAARRKWHEHFRACPACRRLEPCEESVRLLRAAGALKGENRVRFTRPKCEPRKLRKRPQGRAQFR